MNSFDHHSIVLSCHAIATTATATANDDDVVDVDEFKFTLIRY